MKRRTLLTIAISATLTAMLSFGDVAYANSDLGNDFSSGSSGTVVIGSNSAAEDDDTLSDFLDSGEVSDDDLAVGDYLKNQRGMTGSDLQKASEAIFPITNVLGFLSGCLIALLTLCVFLITAIDLTYIAIPPVRGFLYTPNTDGTGAMTAGRFGMMGGPGGQGGMYGNVGGGQQRRKIQWVSDECIQVCAMLGGSSMSEGMGAMGRFGGGFQGQPQMQMSRGSVIKEYLKKRAFFMVLLAVCIIVLMSSALMGTGVNIAQWGLKILSAINNLTSVG